MNRAFLLNRRPFADQGTFAGQRSYVKQGRTRIKRSLMADRTGFEPATSGVTGRHSNQLNYRSVKAYSLMVGGTGIEPVTLAL